ncbi:Gfo/Idh/MocA family oxidoreductase [Candidatus Daviesbacteria bacterium]|nr:Gfo/Idh/MocA family oxidoreductase [Candidatus Daviesbacteria bacterium]
MINREYLIQKLLQVKTAEERIRDIRPMPKSAIILGGGGITAKTYGPKFAKADLPIVALLDTKTKDQAVSLEVLDQVDYYQIPQNYNICDIEKIIHNYSDSALIVMTPQQTHTSILEKLAPLLDKRQIPVWIDKPLAMSVDEVVRISKLIDRFPNLAHLLVSGGFTLDKATPELTLLEGSQKDFLGKLKNVQFLFMEGSRQFREVIGSYGRPHLAFYPGGGMLGDLLEHLTDKLIRMNIIDLKSEFLSVYLGYTPMGEANTSIPWQVPEKKGLAETEAELVIYGKDKLPIFLNFGKRGAQFLGDIRRSKLVFENAVLETDYSDSGNDYTSFFSVTTKDFKTTTELSKDPYILMLERYKKLWSGGINGQGGIYAQLVNAVMIDDIYKIWKGEKPLIFQQSPKSKAFRDISNYKNSDEYFFRQQRDWEAFLRLHQSIIL